MELLFEKLSDLNFTQIGQWTIEKDNINYDRHKKNELLVSNSLYVFVLHQQEKATIIYVGKTTQTLEKRFYGYIRGNGTSTNSRIHKNIKKAIKENKEVTIWALLDETPLNWGIYNINLAAGLEDAFIQIEKPLWNGGKTETETIEAEVQGLVEQKQTLFPIKINKTYYEFGYLNPGVKASSFLGKHNEKIEILVGEDSMKIQGVINRTANINKSVRVNANKRLAAYYQQRYKIGDIATLEVIDFNTIKII